MLLPKLQEQEQEFYLSLVDCTGLRSYKRSLRIKVVVPDSDIYGDDLSITCAKR